MVALGESISEPGLRPVVPRCRVAATYPQGGTGIPAGEMSCPGAAAHMRPAAATEFRRDEGSAFLDRFAAPLNINAPVLQDTYSAGVIQPNSRLYFVQDANWNTTAVIGYDSTTQTWNVVQRYVYSPYGNIIILNPNWIATPSGTVPMVNNLYQGMPLDPVTGLYYERARWYSTSLGTWISQDPAGYINGADTYQFNLGSPTSYVDPTGFNVYTEHGSISFNPMKAGVILAPDRTLTMTYTLKVQYYDAGGTPVVGAVTMPSTGGLGTVPLNLDHIGFVGGYELTYSPATFPLQSTDKCLKIVMVLVKVSAWNFKTISLHGYLGPIPIPGPTYTVKTYLGSVYEKFRIYDNNGSLSVVHEGPSTYP